MKAKTKLLTDSEYNVFRLMLEGHTCMQIALALVKAPGTIKNYVSNALQKLGCETQHVLLSRYAQGTLPLFPVDQTEQTNCGSAVVATIMGLRIKEVPNFWWPTVREEEFQEWLSARGWACFHFTWDFVQANRNACLADGALVALIGPTARGSNQHAVVARLGPNGTYQIVHDPHPSRAGITKPVSIEYFFRMQRPASAAAIKGQ